MTVPTGVVVGAKEERAALQEAVAYYHGTAFLFVPNVCNAKCDFCYVTPAYGRHPRFPEPLLDKAERLARSLHDWGFTEMRITGGEPLAFTNITALIDRVRSAGLSYRVLTNGLNLGSFVPYATEHPPNQITVSVHDLDRLEEIFRVPVDVDGLLEAIHTLSATVEMECTVVVDVPDWPAINRTLSRLASAGVSRVKLLLPNIAKQQDLAAFLAVASQARKTHGSSFREIRSSRLNAPTCGLAKKGFLSVDLSSMRAYACCVQVGEPAQVVADCMRVLSPSPPGSGARFDPLTIVDIHQSASRQSSTFPCTAHYGSCPIALEG